MNVPDLRAAKHYYDALMPALGFAEFLAGSARPADQFAYRPADDKPGTYLFFYPSAEPSTYSRHQTGLQHLAFMAPSRGAIDGIHQLVCELSTTHGGRVLHAPRPFPEYPPPYYATFWLDPWGLMLEAVCHRDTQ